jgi:hypothetical protein
VSSEVRQPSAPDTKVIISLLAEGPGLFRYSVCPTLARMAAFVCAYKIL